MKPSEVQNAISKEAIRRVAQIVPPGDEHNEARKAHLDLEMLAAGFRSQDSMAATLRVLTVHVAQTRSWAKCAFVDPTRWPGGLASHEDFVTEACTLAGSTRNDKSRLIGLANVALYAHQEGISIDAALDTWTQMRTALPALKTAVAQEKPEKVKEILSDVVTLSPKELKDKYVKPRHDKAGWAKIDGLTLVARLNNQDDVERVIRVLGGILEWGLDARVEQDSTGVIVRIERAPSPVWSEAIKEAIG